MKISVVIPALNEAERIADTLAAVAAQPEPWEILVVDGGSADATVEIARRYAPVATSAAGRARQMNHGAALTTGEVLFFLHADTLPPPTAFADLRAALAAPDAEAGCFRLAFDAETPLLRFYSFCTRFALPGICFGDRGLFVRRAVFEAVGGFEEIPLFEDLEMVQRLHRRGGFRFLPAYATTAARRYEARGPLRQQLLNVYLWLRYQAGTAPRKLAPLYHYDPPKALDDVPG